MQHNVGLWKRPTLQHAHHFRKKYLTKNIFFKYWQALNPKLFSFMNVSERSDTEQWSQWPVHAHTFSSPPTTPYPSFPIFQIRSWFFSEGSHWSLPTKGPYMFIYQHRGALWAQSPNTNESILHIEWPLRITSWTFKTILLVKTYTTYIQLHGPTYCHLYYKHL